MTMRTDLAGAGAQHLNLGARRQAGDALVGQQDAQGEGGLEPVLQQAGVDQNGDEHTDAGQHDGADELVELVDAEDRALHRLLTCTRPWSPSRNTCSAATKRAASAARLSTIHNTVAPRSRASAIACAIGTARSAVASSV